MAKSGLDLQDLSIEILDTDPQLFRDPAAALLAIAPRAPDGCFTTTNLRENHRLEIPEMALGGGVAICEQNLHPGSVVDLRLTVGQKSVKAQTIVRDANTQARAFEVVEMDLEERSTAQDPGAAWQLPQAIHAEGTRPACHNRTILFPNI